MTTDFRPCVIQPNFSDAQLETRCLKGWTPLNSLPLYVPVHRVAMEIEIRRFRRRSQQRGIWLIDTLQPYARTASERVELISEDRSHGITLKPGLCVEESPNCARRALLEQRFRFLARPAYVYSEYLDTVYHPFMMLLAARKGRHRLVLLDRVTGEENLFLKERMRFPETVQ